MASASISLTGRALRLLSRREHSRAELERKLARFEEEPGSLEKALDALQAKDFISAQRVVESVVHRRSGKLGAVRIRQELQAKGLEPEAVVQAVAALAASEEDRAQAVWRKKFGSVASDGAATARQMRFLAARGFGSAVIRRVVKGYSEDMPDAD
jgi:regulatory protein